MFKRILRYTLLIICLLIAGVWGWTTVRADYALTFGLRPWEVVLSQGLLGIYHLTPVRDGERLSHGYGQGSFYTNKNQPLSVRLGLIMPAWGETTYSARTLHNVYIPLWTLFTPLLLITAWFWYPIIRNRLRVKRDTGFVVEMKQFEPVKE